MASLQRLICGSSVAVRLRWLLAFITLAFVANSASAAVPLVQQWRVHSDSFNAYPQEFHPSKDAACAALYAVAARNYPGGWGTPAYSLGTSGGIEVCNLTRLGSTSGFAFQSGPAACPANSTASAGACVCSSGFVEKNGQCISAQDPDMKCATDFAMAGFGIGQGLGTIRDTKTMSGVVPSGEMCWPHESATSGCLVNFDRTSLTTMPDGSIQSGGSFTMYKGGVGGKACTLEEPQDPGSTVEEKCEKSGSYTDSKGTHSLCLDEPKCEGGFMGTVSYLGGEVCVKDKGGNVIETSKDIIKKNEDGSTDKVTEKTTCKGNICTTEKTTTTTTNNNTSSSSTTTKTESKEDYCKANANAQQCKGEEEKEGKFGGSCSAGFTCEGDALQCAIAKDQHKRNCQMFDDKTTESQLYDSEVAKGSNRDVTKDLPGNTEVDVAGKLSSEDVLGGGRCIADLSVQVWRSSVTLPFSNICPSLGYLGWVLVAVCSLAAFRIVSGSSKED